MEAPQKRVVSPLKLTFLTDNVRLSEDSQEARSRRTDFVLEALQPVLSIFVRIQEDCKSLDNELQDEIISAFQAMKISAERKFQAAAKKLIQAQRRLEELEDEFERSEKVVGLKHEIEMFSSKSEKVQEQYFALEDQQKEFENRTSLLEADIKMKSAQLKQVSKENIKLHRELASVRLPKIPQKAEAPLADIFKSVPFRVFTELSSQEVGHLTLAQLQTFIGYKKNIEALKSRIEIEKMKTQFQKLANIGDRTRERLEEFFVQCAAAYAQMEMGSYRSPSTTRSLEGTFFPIPPTTQFETMISARLYEIDQSYEQLVRRQNRKYPPFSRRDLDKVPVQYVIRVLLSKKKCLERLQYFLMHPNSFRDSVAVRTDESVEREVAEGKWSFREE